MTTSEAGRLLHAFMSGEIVVKRWSMHIGAQEFPTERGMVT